MKSRAFRANQSYSKRIDTKNNRKAILIRLSRTRFPSYIVPGDSFFVFYMLMLNLALAMFLTK
jgi:hypothetical protein